MTAWTDDELSRAGDAEELQIASARRDGTLGSPRTIWVVPHGDDLYVRSVNGPSAAWFRGTQVRQEGRIDKIVPPGHNLNPADGGWASPALEPAVRRR